MVVGHCLQIKKAGALNQGLKFGEVMSWKRGKLDSEEKGKTNWKLEMIKESEKG